MASSPAKIRQKPNNDASVRGNNDWQTPTCLPKDLMLVVNQVWRFPVSAPAWSWHTRKKKNCNSNANAVTYSVAPADNWKDHAACHSLEEDELPAGIRLHETMELVGYLCPACGRRHSLDVKERGVAPLHDLKITRWVSPQKTLDR